MIIIPVNIASKKNSKRLVRPKGGGRMIPIPSKAYKAFEQTVESWLVSNGLKYPYDGQIWVKATVYYRGPRPDLSGALESVGDVFEGFLWKNDRQIESWDGSRVIHDKDNPRIELTIRKFEK